jgi:hypothetical protein
MDFDVLPGPSLGETARTIMARVPAAVVGCAGSPALPPFTVPVRTGPAGAPVLLPRPGSALAGRLAADPVLVTVTVPADAPFSALALTGMTRPVTHVPAAYPVTVRSLEFTGAVPVPVSLAEYEAAAPDPFWREAPGILRHLEQCHLAELADWVRAHGIRAAECVIPRRLDRFGLEFLVFTADGVAAVRLAFPDGPVTSLAEVPASVRTVLTCRCATATGRSG